jgi:hypothetical protein
MWASRILSLCSLLLVSCVIPGQDDRNDRENDRGNAGASQGSGSGSPRNESARTRTADEFCQQWARAACSEAVVSACQASNAEECRQTQAGYCRNLVPEQIASTGSDNCIAAVGAAYRDADLRGDELALVLRFSGACARTVVGPNKEADDCSVNTDCDVSRGYSCVRKADAEAGTCQAAQVVEPGRDCRDAEKTCQDGFFCDGRNCIETLATGESCAINEQCGQNGFCDASGACAERRAVNDSCENDVECARGICSALTDEKVCTDRIVLSRADPVCENLR